MDPSNAPLVSSDYAEILDGPIWERHIPPQHVADLFPDRDEIRREILARLAPLDVAGQVAACARTVIVNGVSYARDRVLCAVTVSHETIEGANSDKIRTAVIEGARLVAEHIKARAARHGLTVVHPRTVGVLTNEGAWIIVDMLSDAYKVIIGGYYFLTPAGKLADE